MKPNIFILACLYAVLSINASADRIMLDGIIYTTQNDKTACVNANSPAYSGSIVIPSSITYGDEKYIVESIGDSAFHKCLYLTAIALPETIKSIGKEAFSGCSSLASICIPNSVQEIGTWAFYQCQNLTSATIGKNVKSIDSAAFLGCYSLASIIVNEENPTYDSRSGCNAIIETESNTLIFGCKNTIIPNDVTKIGDYAFYYCKGLQVISIPTSVLSIGQSAFRGCDKLTSIILPNSIKIIGNDALVECRALSDIYCYATSLPRMEASAIDEQLTQRATLHVPASSITFYRLKEPWMYFERIVSI